MAGRGILDAELHRGQGRQVEHQLRARYRPAHGFGIGHVARNDFRRGPNAGQVLSQACAEVIEHAHRAGPAL